MEIDGVDFNNDYLLNHALWTFVFSFSGERWISCFERLRILDMRHMARHVDQMLFYLSCCQSR